MSRVQPPLFVRNAAPRRCALLGALSLGILAGGLETVRCDESFVRGDANGNSRLELSDAIRIFGYLFLGQAAPSCQDAADANDTGDLDVSDGIYTLGFLFLGKEPPPPPYPDAGPDPTDDLLTCEGGGGCVEWVNSAGMRFVTIPPGSFLMGSPPGERGRWVVEGPVHEVHITRPFLLGVTEVTQEQYERVMGNNPSFFHGGEFGVDLERPVEQVNWEDAQEFCRRLSDMEGRPYRLPTEAEWEYACRAGTSTRFFFGDALECDDDCGPCPQADAYVWWCATSSPARTSPVGRKQPNPWCLHDMSGNVWEWCQDWVERYPEGEVTDPQGPPSGSEKPMRGGAWNASLNQARSAMRGDLSTEHRFEFLGFRVALPEEPDGR